MATGWLHQVSEVEIETEPANPHQGDAMSAAHTQLATESDWRELASRENDGLEVSLLWSKSADRVKVTVADSKLDQEFELDVAGRRRARGLPPPVRVRNQPGHDLRASRSPRVHSTYSRRAEKEHDMSPAQALEELRGPDGPLERKPLEDGRRRLARFRRPVRVRRDAGRHEADLAERRQRRRVPHRRPDHLRRRLHRRQEGREHRGADRDGAHPVQDADRERSGLPGRDRRLRSGPSARSRR